MATVAIVNAKARARLWRGGNAAWRDSQDHRFVKIFRSHAAFADYQPNGILNGVLAAQPSDSVSQLQVAQGLTAGHSWGHYTIAHITSNKLRQHSIA